MLKLDFEKCGGLIPVIAQDFETKDVLMLAYINEEAWRETLATGRASIFPAAATNCGAKARRAEIIRSYAK